LRKSALKTTPAGVPVLAAVPLAALIAHLADETLAVHGATDLVIERPAALGDRAAQSAIGFCALKGRPALAQIRASGAAVMLCRPEVAQALGRRPAGKALIAVANPRLAFARVLARFFAPPGLEGIHESAVIDACAALAPNVAVGPCATIGAARIGEGTVIHAGARIGSGVTLGRNVIVHAGAVIGADGFGYERDGAGRLVKLPQLGGVVIEDDVEIGANACIDRGTLGDTVIGEGTKIDDLAYVAHNVAIGKHVLVMARAVIAGSCRIADAAQIAPGAVVRDHVNVGAGATVGLGAVVIADVPEGATVAGVPAKALRRRATRRAGKDVGGTGRGGPAVHGARPRRRT